VVATPGDDTNMAAIAYFQASLQENALTWFNSLDIPTTIGTLDGVITAFEEKFVYDISSSMEAIGNVL